MKFKATKFKELRLTSTKVHGHMLIPPWIFRECKTFMHDKMFRTKGCHIFTFYLVLYLFCYLGNARSGNLHSFGNTT
jgi:hypothetical protein